MTKSNKPSHDAFANIQSVIHVVNGMGAFNRPGNWTAQMFVASLAQACHNTVHGTKWVRKQAGKPVLNKAGKATVDSGKWSLNLQIANRRVALEETSEKAGHDISVLANDPRYLGLLSALEADEALRDGILALLDDCKALYAECSNDGKVWEPRHVVEAREAEAANATAEPDEDIIERMKKAGLLKGKPGNVTKAG